MGMQSTLPIDKCLHSFPTKSRLGSQNCEKKVAREAKGRYLGGENISR